MTPTPLTLGIVGLGAMGRLYVDVLSRTGQDDWRVVAACDASDAVMPRGVRQLHLDQLLRHPGIDAVAVATPPHLHHRIALAALGADKHVLVEKPPALSGEQLAQMEQAASRGHRTLFTAFHARYGPAVRAAAEALAGREIVSVDVTYREDVFGYHRPDAWVFDQRRAGGGVVMDSGINVVSVLTALAAVEAPEIRSAQLGRPGDLDLAVETSADVAFTWSGDRQGRLRLDWLHRGAETRLFEFRTSHGPVTLDIVRQRVVMDGQLLRGGDPGRDHVDQGEEYAHLFSDFAAAVRAGLSVTGRVELGFIEAVYRSARTQ